MIWFARRGRLAATSALAVATLVLAACGGGSGDSGATTGGSADSIKIMATGIFDSPSLGFGYPEVLTTIKAHADAVNAAGGVNGHQLEIVECNDQGDPNVAAGCARDAVSDKVSAVIAGFSLFADSITPVLEAANIPFVGNAVLSPTDGTSPVSFPMDGGSPVTALASAAALIAGGCKNAGIVSLELPTSASYVDIFTKSFTAAGGTVAPVSVPATGAASYAAQVSTILSQGATCTGAPLTPTEFNKLLVAVRQSGQDILVATGAATGLASVGAASGSAADGLLLVNATYLPSDTDVPGIKTLTAELAAHAPGTAIIQPALPTFAGFELLGEALKTAKSTDAPDVLAALNDIKDFDTGLTPPISTHELDVPGYNRMFNTSALNYKVVDGKVVRQGDFVDFKDQLSKVAG